MDRTSQALAYDGQTGKDLVAWQRKLRKKFTQLLGLDVLLAQEKCNLRPRTVWRREHELGTIEKVVFTSEPFADVPAFVCLPKDAQPPYTFFICLQGHSTGMHNSIGVDRDDNTKPIKVEGDRDFALGCMKRGLAAIAIEQRSFGERREQVQSHISTYNTCHDAAMHALMLGRTLAAERVYDVERTIDYLASRGDADMNRVGVMGNSGGGTISLFAAATLKRIAWVMPSCYFCTFRDSIMSIYHCGDNYVPHLYQWAEMSDIAGLVAPRPVVMVAGQEDEIFPIKATKRAFKALQSIYAAAEARRNCQLVVGPEGHRFYADLAWPRMLRYLQD